jgi:hypothetical protein
MIIFLLILVIVAIVWPDAIAAMLGFLCGALVIAAVIGSVAVAVAVVT